MLTWVGATAAAAELLQFGNGLRVVLDPDPPATRVSAATTFAVGEVDDPEGEEGAAHLVEHLWFRSPDPAGVRTWDALEAAGCEVQARTASDHTDYRTSCPPEGLGVLLERELARLAGPLTGVDELDLGHALAVVGHEEAERAQSSGLLVYPLVLEALYPAEHPLVARAARPPVAAPTLDQLRTFSATAYAPAHASLALTGPFDPEAVRATLIEQFGPPASAVFPAERRAVPSPRRTLRPAPRSVHLPVDHPMLVLAWAPPRDATFAFQGPLLADLVARVLFFRWLGRADVIGSGCEIVSDSLGSPLLCRVELQDDAPVDDLALELRAVAAGMWAGRGGKVVKEMFPAARSQYAAGIALAHDDRGVSSGGRADWLAQGAHTSGVTDPFAAARANVEGLDPRSLLAVAVEHLVPEQALVLVVHPDGRSAPTLTASATTPSRPAVPPTTLPTAEPPLQVAERTLANGLRILAAQRRDSQVLHAAVRVRRQAGPAPGSDVVDLLVSGDPPAHLLLDVMPSTHHDLGVAGTVHAVHGLAADPGLVLDRLGTQVADLELQLLLRGPLVERQRASWERKHLEPSGWAAALALLGSDPTGSLAWDLSGRAFDDRLAVGPLEVAADLIRRYSPDNLEVVLVGPQSPEALLQLAEDRFADWESKKAPPVAAQPPPPPRETDPLVVIDDPDADRAKVYYGCALPDGTDEVVVELAQAALRTELWQRLREQSSVVYTPDVDAISWTKVNSALLLSAEVPWDRSGDALVSMREALDAVGDGDDGALAVARTRTLSDGPSRGSPIDTLRFALGVDQVRSAEALRTWSDRVGGASRADVASALAGCVAEARVAIAGPAEATARILRDRGLEPRVLTVEQARATVAP